MSREPVVTTAAIVGAIMSVVTAAVAFGLVQWTPEQMGALEAALTSIVPLLLTLAGGWLVRSQVTPMKAPRTQDGKPAAIVEKGK